MEQNDKIVKECIDKVREVHCFELFNVGDKDKEMVELKDKDYYLYRRSNHPQHGNGIIMAKRFDQFEKEELEQLLNKEYN